MITLQAIHHVAVICANYKKSKHFYTEILGFKIICETYRQERNSYKLDLSLNGMYVLELFSFPDTPPRITNPEACGLRHIAFEVENVEAVVAELKNKNIFSEPVRKDETTGKFFTFILDPDKLPIELYQK